MNDSFREDRVAIPSRPSQDVAAEAASDLGVAIEAIERWGVTVPPDSRLRQAWSLLTDVSHTGRISPEQRGDTLGHRALQVAMDFADIARTLPTGRHADYRKDLTRAIAGPLYDMAEPGSAAQFQSQLMVRTAFVKAGADTTLPTWSGRDGRKKPDLLIEDGLVQLAVEVKRPSRWKTMMPRATDAAAQILDAGLQGGIVLDVTDCLDGIPPAEWDDKLLRAAEEMAQLFFVRGRGFQPGYSHILILLLFARPAWYAVEENGNTQVMVYNSSVSWAFAMERGTIGYLRGQRLRAQLERGLNRLGFTSHEQ